jgi:aryl sulfotransferase
MKTIFWLASYPKSGNTWVRLLLASYRGEAAETIDINLLGGDIATSRELFEEFTGVDGSELTQTELERYRPRVYRALAARQSNPVFLKAHDACSQNRDGEWLFPPDITAGVIYLIRNPLDVAVSYAHHTGFAPERIVQMMCDEKFVASRGDISLHAQLPQRLLSWSGHIRSWVDESGLPVLVIRYEDLLEQPHAFFRSILEFSGLPIEENRLALSVEATRFGKLQTQEREHGFHERHAHSKSFFFRNGKAGGWSSELNLALAQTIIDSHHDMMLRFGYLNRDRSPVF